MSTFFKNYPRLGYYFGEELDASLFQNLGVYIDLIDQIADDANYYDNYSILDGERPDALSYKLYGTTDYYWTFFLLNEKLRQQGWPLSFQEIQKLSKQYYPNLVITTETDLSDRMYRNNIVIQGDRDDPSAVGQVIERNLDLGQLVIKPIIEVRRVQVNNAGAGYVSRPTVTFTGNYDVNAVATTSLNANGTVASINVVSGGEGWDVAPTVTLSEPEIVDYNEVANTIDSILDGTITTGTYYNFIQETFGGYKRGDINSSGAISSDDSTLLRTYASDPNSVDVDVASRIKTAIRQGILSNASTYPVWLPVGSTGTTATATAVLSSNTFAADRNAFTVPNITNYRQFQAEANIVNEKSIAVKSSVVQYNATHHYEDKNGDWVDINPADQENIPATSLPVTYLERLEKENDELKNIKILRPEVAAQVFNEFQVLLRNNV